ncbi:MAG: hypothetical protein HC824_06025 [Synechococcales cyanobacterium RM1_1_8]|nr:hypothetical protein [Synechococcales cyanobacterium RM1_1_8]
MGGWDLSRSISPGRPGGLHRISVVLDASFDREILQVYIAAAALGHPLGSLPGQ